MLSKPIRGGKSKESFTDLIVNEPKSTIVLLF